MSSSTSKVCFNSSCKGPSEKWCRGWRCRTGEYAHLCDRCGAAYEEGKFCETFHINTPGWRCCESCGKQVHCGCIVSFHLFVLLDAGGIECLTCAKRTYILTPNPAWPPPSHFLPSQSERMKDLSGKSWSAFAGLGPVPWRQAPTVLNDSNFRTDVHPKVPFEIDITGSIERFRTCERLSTTSFKTRQKSYYETLYNGKAGLDPFETVRHGTSGGLNGKEQHYPFVNELNGIFPKNDSSFSKLLLTAISSKTKTDDTQPSTLSTSVGKHVSCYNGMDTSGETLTCNGKARGDGQNQMKLLRYRPQITNEELQQISGDSKSAVTPMFEKMLTASDAGRIGRLVIPKKCAEAYFPPIAQPEGLPLKVQDAKGKEWVLQFRYWPNNNSRMYVLEGITPCIQSMQLQAGDIVTFSRVEPEGKLVIGGRKASTIPSSDQGDKGVIIGSGSSVMRDDIGTKKCGEVILMNCHMKGKSSNSILPINEAQTSILEDKPASHRKRKNVNLDIKTKHLKIENKVIIELNLTFNEAQGLMRPPANIVPPVIVVEGCEFEEFEEAAPVIGRPTIPGIDHFGEKIQWVQCEDCFRWRKVPADALLPSRWICSGNEWDLDRSLCSSAEELTTEQVEDFLNAIKDSPEKFCTKQDTDVLVSQEGLNTLANLAIQEDPEGDGPEARTKHPRHKPNCACIVCLQPPSGQGLNHSDSCECVVCSSLKRRFKTLMERREKKQLEKGAASAIHVSDFDAFYRPNVGNSGVDKEIVEKDSVSPLKGKIDLNIQPDRDEELLSPGLDPKRVNSCLPGHQICSGSKVLEKVEEEELKQDGVCGSDFNSSVGADGNSQKTD